MSNYVKAKVYLSDSQKSKLKLALRNQDNLTLQIDKTKAPNHEMYLTKTQINQINNGKRITVSKTQLKKNGGFLPFLIPILTGLLSGTAGWGAKKLLDKVTGSGCPKKKKNGKGVLQNWESVTKR